MKDILSMPSECERYFRESLDALLNDVTMDLPWRLADALVEHRWRTDGAGLSLCFANPERERLLAELTPVLLAHLAARHGPPSVSSLLSRAIRS